MSVLSVSTPSVVRTFATYAPVRILFRGATRRCMVSCDETAERTPSSPFASDMSMVSEPTQCAMICSESAPLPASTCSTAAG